MITSANAPQMVNGKRYTGRRKAALIAGGSTAAAAAAGGQYGPRLARNYRDYHYLRAGIIHQTPRGPSHSIQDRWIMPAIQGKKTWRGRVYEKYVERHQQLARIAKSPAWRRARWAGLLGLGATGAAAGAMALWPSRDKR